MGARGPHPKSAKTRKLRGNKRAVAAEVKLPPGVPAAPPWLDEVAAGFWQYTVDSLSPSLAWALADRDALIRYCLAMADVVESAKAVRGLPFGDEEANKTRRIHQQNLRTADAIGQQLYLTPAARARLKAPDKPPEDDPLIALLRENVKNKKA